MSKTIADQLESASPVIPAAAERPERRDREPVVVRRQAALSAVIGLGASLLGALYLWRAVDQDGAGSWLVGLALAGLAAFHLAQWVDARTPLLVADATGVRLRLGNTWHGLLWDDVDRVTVRERRGLLRDGRVVVHPQDEAALRGLGGRSRRRLAANTRMYGAPFALPLGLTTVVSTDDLAGALQDLSTAETAVELAGPADAEPQPVPEPGPGPEPEPGPEPQPGPEPEPAPEPGPMPEPEPMPGADPTADGGVAEPDEDTRHEPVAAVTEPPAPVRPVRRATRVDVTRPTTKRAQVLGRLAVQDRGLDDLDAPDDLENLDDLDGRDAADPQAPSEPGRPARVPRPRDNIGRVLGSPPAPHADPPSRAPGPDAGPATTGLQRPQTEPARDPVIGPVLADARRILRLSVDDLATRTRIRPHVIEAIEVDDFGPCAGDFYARGHLRALSRVLGIDPTPLLVRYEELYATAPVEARRVFEAELAAGDAGAIRGVGTHTGPRWGGLIAAVVVLAVVWALAGMFLDDARELVSGDAGAAHPAAHPSAPADATASLRR
jgi:cytoskeleton protein RodZ